MIHCNVCGRIKHVGANECPGQLCKSVALIAKAVAKEELNEEEKASFSSILGEADQKKPIG